MKTCNVCNQEKPIDDFYKNCKAKDGHAWTCKSCVAQVVIEWRNKNRGRVRESNRLSAQRNPERGRKNSRRWAEANPEKGKASRDKYYINHKDEVNERARRFAATHPERHREQTRVWRQDNPEKCKEVKARRRAQKYNTTVGRVSYKHIIQRDGMICHICEQEVQQEDLHFDHVVPLSRGGSHTIDNIRVSHSKCNLKKHNKLMEELT